MLVVSRENIFLRFTSIATKYDYYDRIGEIWEQSEGLYGSYSLFTVNVRLMES